jgi:hypothetical protein
MSQMKSMRIIAAGLSGKQLKPLHCLPTNLQQPHLLNAVLWFNSGQVELAAPPSSVLPLFG